MQVPVGIQSVAGTPAQQPPTPNWITVAAGEPLPGVSLDLRMPSLAPVAGTMAVAEFAVHNGSGQEIAVTNAILIVKDRPAGAATPDPREFYTVPRTGPLGAYEMRVPPGQTRVATSFTQLPFDTDPAIRLHATAGLGTMTSGNPSSDGWKALEVEIPLRLSPPSPADEVRLELVADNQEWCLRATDSQGRSATGPFDVALTLASAGRTSMMSELPRDSVRNTWAMRWFSYASPLQGAAAPVTLTVWVGGPHYVTARAEAQIAP